jgi:hypothetical protein
LRMQTATKRIEDFVPAVRCRSKKICISIANANE